MLHIMGQHGFKAIPRRAEGQKDQRRGVEPRDSAGQTSAHPIPLAGSHRKSIRGRYGAEPSTQDTKEPSTRTKKCSSAGRLTHPKAAAHPSHKVWPVLPASRCSASCTPPSPPLFSPLWAFRLLAAGLAGATLALRLKFSRCERRRVSKFGCLRFSGARRSSISTLYRVR